VISVRFFGYDHLITAHPGLSINRLMMMHTASRIAFFLQKKTTKAFAQKGVAFVATVDQRIDFF